MKHYLHLITALTLTASTWATMSANVSLSEVTGGEKLYGYILSTETGKRAGSWNEISEEGNISQLWQDTETDYYMLSGWMRRGMLCEIGVKTNAAGTISSAYSYIARNVETGEIFNESRYAISQYRQSYFSSATYCNSATQEGIYGFVMDPDYESYPVWKKAPANGELTQVESIKVLDDPYSWCPSLCYNETDECFYGISFRGLVMKIDFDGNMETLFELEDVVKGVPAALYYIPATKKMLWSGTLKDGTSGLYCIDPNNHTCEKIKDLNAKEVFMAFVVESTKQLDKVPSTVKDLTIEFLNGSSNGTAKFTLPTTLMDGQEIASGSELTYNLLIDDSTLITGKGVAGNETTAQMTGLSQGEHKFYVSAIYNGYESSEVSTSSYVGNDIPVATSKVTLEADGYTLLASWEAVKDGVHGGWVDTTAMTYDVYLNSEYMETTSALTWEYFVDEDTPLAGYIVSIVAKCNGLESAMKNSKAVACGAALDLDVYIAPTAEQSALMTYIADKETSWKFNDSYTPPVFSSGAHYSSSDPLDTWLIMPPIQFPKAGEYVLDFKTGVLMDYDKGEYFSVYLGKNNIVEAMTTQIIDEINPTEAHPECDQITESFEITEPGTYYIGFHCTSEARKLGALLWDINVMTGTGVSELETTGICAYGANGVIVTDGNNGDTVNIYSLDGSRIASGKIGDSALTFKVNKGIYVVTVEKESYKVIVK